MTVCIGGIFRWDYTKAGGPPDVGGAILTVSDRMITAGDIQYEPAQQKVAQVNPSTIVLIAGDYAIHSQAVANTLRQVRGDPKVAPYNVAQIYARSLQDIKQRQAEDKFLAPLGLNTESFISQQRDMSDAFVAQITAQLQDYDGAEVEAIVSGIDKENNGAHIYQIDTRGTVRCFDDVGFSAVGIGAWHARSSLMQAQFMNNWYFAPALTHLYGAKKVADGVAPGVGKGTDIWMIVRDGIFPLSSRVFNNLNVILERYREKHRELVWNAITELNGTVYDPRSEETPRSRPETAGENPEGNNSDQGRGFEESPKDSSDKE